MGRGCPLLGGEGIRGAGGTRGSIVGSPTLVRFAARARSRRPAAPHPVRSSLPEWPCPRLSANPARRRADGRIDHRTGRQTDGAAGGADWVRGGEHSRAEPRAAARRAPGRGLRGGLRRPRLWGGASGAAGPRRGADPALVAEIGGRSAPVREPRRARAVKRRSGSAARAGSASCSTRAAATCGAPGQRRRGLRERPGERPGGGQRRRRARPGAGGDAAEPLAWRPRGRLRAPPALEALRLRGRAVAAEVLQLARTAPGRPPSPGHAAREVGHARGQAAPARARARALGERPGRGRARAPRRARGPWRGRSSLGSRPPRDGVARPRTRRGPRARLSAPGAISVALLPKACRHRPAPRTARRAGRPALHGTGRLVRSGCRRSAACRAPGAPAVTARAGSDERSRAKAAILGAAARPPGQGGSRALGQQVEGPPPLEIGRKGSPASASPPPSSLSTPPSSSTASPKACSCSLWTFTPRSRPWA